MSGINEYSILESWPMIREDFEEFTKDPTCWFINNMEKALANSNLESVKNLMEIFKIVNAPSSTHNH
jgi:hypothetical protein